MVRSTDTDFHFIWRAGLEVIGIDAACILTRMAGRKVGFRQRGYGWVCCIDKGEHGGSCDGVGRVRIPLQLQW